MMAETLIGSTPNLRAPSHSVLRLLHILNDLNADCDEVIHIVAEDPVLTGKLLALCNSARYGLAKPVASIQQAVQYLGFGEIHRIVIALGFGDTIGTPLPGYDMEAGDLWRHSLVAAQLAPHVARLSRHTEVDSSVAYTAGLLHDIGKIVIGQTIDEVTRERIRHLVEHESVSVLEAENTMLGCDHAEIGACLLRQWHIPEILTDAVATHHKPRLNGRASLSAVVHAADAIAHQVGASPGWGSFAVNRDSGAWNALELSEQDLEVLTFQAIESDTKLGFVDESPTSRPSVPLLESLSF